jgi:polysaccharide biosynthesis transport protein
MRDTQRHRSQSVRESTSAALQRQFQVLMKRKWIVVAMLTVVVGATAIWSFSRTRIYRSRASVLIDFRAPQVLGSKVREVVDLAINRSWRSKSYLETQKRVVSSDAVSIRVAERLALPSNPSFWGKGVNLAEQTPTLKQAAARLGGMVRANIVRNSNILEIRVDHHDPELAAEICNSVVQAYLDFNVDYKATSAQGAVKWLANQLDDLKKELETSELALHEFKRKNNIISVSMKDKQSLIARRIWQLAESLTETRMKRMALSAQRKQVHKARKDPSLKMALSAVQKSHLVQTMRSTYSEEYKKYQGLRQRYLDKHPVVLEQKAKVDSTRNALDREVNNIVAGIESKYREYLDNERQLAGALQVAKNEGLQINKREVSYRRLNRQRANTEQVYSLVMSRMKETDLSGQLRVNNVRWLDRAVAPVVPSSPRVRLNILLGAFIGLLLGIAFAFLVDILDNTIKSQDDILAIPRLLFLGLLPRFPSTPSGKSKRQRPVDPNHDLLVHRNSKSPVAESCRAIRTNLLFASPDQPMKRFVITSAGPKEGKTTTSVSLAIIMAQAGNKVVIVDTDMRRPDLHRIFGVPGSEGITSVLLGDAKLEDVIKSTEIPNLYVLPCGPIPPNPAELCQSDAFQQLIDDLSERFDRTILDSPPVMVVTDAVLLSTLSDGVLLVARSGRTGRAALRDTVQQLTDVSANIFGCVLNDMDLDKRGYGYYRYRRYGYSGYYRYGQYGDNDTEATSTPS